MKSLLIVLELSEYLFHISNFKSLSNTANTVMGLALIHELSFQTEQRSLQFNCLPRPCASWSDVLFPCGLCDDFFQTCHLCHMCQALQQGPLLDTVPVPVPGLPDMVLEQDMGPERGLQQVADMEPVPVQVQAWDTGLVRVLEASDMVTDRVPEKAPERVKERVLERAQERAPERAPERAQEMALERVLEMELEMGLEKVPDLDLEKESAAIKEIRVYQELRDNNFNGSNFGPNQNESLRELRGEGWTTTNLTFKTQALVQLLSRLIRPLYGTR